MTATHNTMEGPSLDARPEQKIAIVVRFVPATNTRSSKISLSLPRWDGKRKVVPYDHECVDTEEGARMWLAKHGVTPDALLDMGDHYILACAWAQRPAIFRAWGIPESS